MSDSEYGPPSSSALDGFRAAAVIVRRALDAAAKDRPRRMSGKMRKLAAYREGYYAGLLLAHCQHALGKFPEQNAEEIRKALTSRHILTQHNRRSRHARSQAIQ